VRDFKLYIIESAYITWIQADLYCPQNRKPNDNNQSHIVTIQACVHYTQAVQFCVFSHIYIGNVRILDIHSFCKLLQWLWIYLSWCRTYMTQMQVLVAPKQAHFMHTCLFAV